MSKVDYQNKVLLNILSVETLYSITCAIIMLSNKHLEMPDL